MVFNSLFGIKRSSEIPETERDASVSSNDARQRTGEVEKDIVVGQEKSISEAEARILRAVSKSSISGTDDGTEIIFPFCYL